MTFYAALDVSVRTVAICIVDQEGAIRLERSVRSELPDILKVLSEFGEPIAKVGFEAGVLTQHLTYGLRAVGYEVNRADRDCEQKRDPRENDPTGRQQNWSLTPMPD